MFIPLGNDASAIVEAAEQCGLLVDSGGRIFAFGKLNPEDLPPWMTPGYTEPDDTEFVLCLKPEAAAKCSRPPYEVGVFLHHDCFYAVWDGQKDGFGLSAYIGHAGERLRTAYVIDAANRIADALGLAPSKALVRKDQLVLEYRNVAQEKISVRVDPKGAVQIATEGFKGKACQDATAQLEKALGTKTADKPTQEMYTPPEQVTTIG